MDLLAGLEICGKTELRSKIASCDPDFIVSISDPTDRTFVDPHLQGSKATVFCMDFREPYGNDWSHRLGSEMIEGLVRAIEPWLIAEPGQSRLLVHCYAGERRSPAMAWAALCLRASKCGQSMVDLAPKFLARFNHAEPSGYVIDVVGMCDAFDEVASGELHAVRQKRAAERAISAPRPVKAKKRLFRI